MPYQLVCEGATSVPVIGSGTVVDACTAAGGVVAWVEQGAGLLPDLTLEEGGQIATAILLLWATAFAFRVIKRQLQES